MIIPTFEKCCFTIERSIQKYRENGKHPDRMTPSDLTVQKLNGPLYVKTNNMACAPSENSDQPGHPPSLIRVFAVRSKDSQGPKASSSGQRRLWSDWAAAQADLSLCWAHMSFCWFRYAVALIVLLWYLSTVSFYVFTGMSKRLQIKLGASFQDLCEQR